MKTTRAELELFGRSLGCDDRVALEATGNSLAIARILEPHVGEVVIANARKLKAISHAKLSSAAEKCRWMNIEKCRSTARV